METNKLTAHRLWAFNSGDIILLVKNNCINLSKRNLTHKIVYLVSEKSFLAEIVMYTSSMHLVM